jgi:hypothetical protein
LKCLRERVGCAKGVELRQVRIFAEAEEGCGDVGWGRVGEWQPLRRTVLTRR